MKARKSLSVAIYATTPFKRQNQNNRREYEIGGVSVSTVSPLTSSFEFSLTIAHLITKVVKYGLNKNPWPLLLHVGTVIYPLLKQLSWKLDKFSINISPTTVAYFQIVKFPIPTRVFINKDNCSICFDPMTKDQDLQAMCFSHAVHKQCFAQGLKPVTSSRNSGLTALSDVIRKCPVCRFEKPVHEWMGNVSSPFRQFFEDLNLRFKLPDMNQALFEKICCVYSVMQAILSCLLRYPELAPSVFEIQKKLFIVDCLLLAGLQHYLWIHLGAHNRYFNFLELEQPYKTLFLSCITTFLMTSGLVSQLMPLQTTKALGHLFSMPDVSASSSPPLIFKRLCAAYFFRFLSTSLLAFFSTDKKINIISALAQGVGFKNILGLRWVTLSQRLKLPISHILQAGGTLSQSITPKNFEEVMVEGSFLVPPSCELSHFEATCQSIKNCWESLFKGSRWICHSVVYKIDIYRWDLLKNHFFSVMSIPDYKLKGWMEHLFYTTYLSPLKVSCPCTLPLSLTDVAIRVFTKVYGFKEVVVLFSD